MFPSIVIRSEASTYPHHYTHVPACPLMIYKVIQDSCLHNMDSGCNSRVVGKLSWDENEQVTALNNKVDFTNKTTSFILEKIPLRDTPITLISLGSGGLLAEYFIHEQIKNSGYQNISWRIIDPCYQNGGFEDSRKEFNQKVDGKVKTFTAEQTYLNESSGVGDEKLAVSDKHHGAVVVLSINPPAILSSEEPIDNSYLSLRGNAVKDMSKANAIYLMVTNDSEKESVQEAMNQLHYDIELITSEYILKYSINKQGRHEVNFGQSKSGDAIKSDVETFLNIHNQESNLGTDNIKLSDIDQTLDKYISALPAVGAYGAKIFVSDYDNSIVELNNFFGDSHHTTLFASFDKNQTSFERTE